MSSSAGDKIIKLLFSMNQRAFQSRGEEKVSEWLTELGAEFIAQPSTRGADEPRIDFLVLDPVMMAIEVESQTSFHGVRMKTRRFLAKRLAIAERFSPSVPVVVIQIGAEELTPMPFADATFSCDALPDLQTLQSVKTKSNLRIIFENTADGLESTQTSTKELQSRWESSCTFKSLFERDNYPKESLAACIHRALVAEFANFLDDLENPRGRRDHFNRQETPSRQKRPAEERFQKRPAEERFQLSGRSNKVIKEITSQYIIERIGGKLERTTVRIEDEGVCTTMQRPSWISPLKKRHNLVFLEASGSSLRHKSAELNGEAAVFRAQRKDLATQILLLALRENRLEYDTISGKKEIIKPIGGKEWSAINQLEAGGWIVLPWDFHEATPEIIRQLQKFDGGGADE